MTDEIVPPALEALGAQLGAARRDQIDLDRGRQRVDVAIATMRHGEAARFGDRARAGTRGMWQGKWPALAAATIAAAVIVIGWNQISDGHTGAAAPASIYTTANGQRANITLPDGSTVALNVASRIEVPANFGAGNHTVRLTGEALFTVSHHAGTPFTVVSGQATARVLGTSFVVRHYASDSLALIAVRDGKVAVQPVSRSSREPDVLSAMQQVVVDARGASTVSAADLTQFSFATGMLEFNNARLSDAIPALNRWYDVDIRLGSPALRARKIVGGFKAGSITDVSGTLELLFNVRVVRDGNVLTLYPRG